MAAPSKKSFDTERWLDLEFETKGSDRMHLVDVTCKFNAWEFYSSTNRRKIKVLLDR